MLEIQKDPMLDLVSMLLADEETKRVIVPVITTSIVIVGLMLLNGPEFIDQVFKSLMRSNDYSEIQEKITEPITRGILRYSKTGNKEDVFAEIFTSLQMELMLEDFEPTVKG